MTEVDSPFKDIEDALERIARALEELLKLAQGVPSE